MVIFYFLGPYRAIFGVGKGTNTVFGSTHVVEQLSFSMLSSFLIFDFYLILGYLLVFGAQMGYFLGLSRAQQLFLGLLM